MVGQLKLKEAMSISLLSLMIRVEVENQSSKHIKAIQSDRCGIYRLGDFKDYLTKNQIISQLTAPGTPQQNGAVERRNWTLLEMVRSIMSYLNCLFLFGGMPSIQQCTI